jgi:signal transduction histidine kinase
MTANPFRGPEGAFRRRRHGDSFVAQWLILAVVLAVLGGTLAWAQFAEYQRIDRQEGERLANQAEIVEKNVVPQLLLANRVIDEILRDLPAWRAQRDGFKNADRQLGVINDSMIGIRPILIIQADGTVIASSNETLIGKNFAHREYFKTALANPDPAVLHVSAPFKTVLDTYVISLFRVIPAPDGGFGGIVIVSVVPEYFSILLDSVRYTPDTRATIVHGRGRVFLSSPKTKGLDGTDVALPHTFFTRHRESGRPSSVFAGATATGDERMIAFHTIQIRTPVMDQPLVVTVSRDLAGIFVPWRRNLYLQVILFALLAVSGVAGLLLLQRRRRDQIAERRKAEEEILLLNETLEQRVHTRTMELEAAGQEMAAFSYSISHDLRAPLRSIVGFSTILAGNLKGKLEDKDRDYFERIVNNALKMGRLIDEVLQYSRLARSAVARQQVDLDALVADVAAELGEQYPRADIVRMPLGSADVDMTMMRQIFYNLIGNALKYSATRSNPRVEVGMQVAGDTVEYYVRDNGIGFDMQHADGLFGLFNRLHSDPRYEGTGAGLAIVKRLVERHNGRISASAAPDAGATFRFHV